MRAWLTGGSRAGDRVGFEGELPSTLVIDGEPYRLVGTRTPRVYVAAGRRKWAPFTDAEKDDVVRHVAAGESISKACQLVGVSSAAVYRHRKVDPSFREALERARRGEQVTSVDEAPWSSEVREWESAMTRLPFVAGLRDGEVYPCGPPNLLDYDGERYRLTTDDEGRLCYVAESAKDAFFDLAVRRFERDFDRDDEDGGL